MDLGSFFFFWGGGEGGGGGHVTAYWLILVISLPPLSVIVCLLYLVISPLAVGKVAFFRTGTGFRFMPSLCFLCFCKSFSEVVSCKKASLPCLPPLGRNEVISCSIAPLGGFSCRPLVQNHSSLSAPLPSSAPGPSCALSSCLEALKLFA